MSHKITISKIAVQTQNWETSSELWKFNKSCKTKHSRRKTRPFYIQWMIVSTIAREGPSAIRAKYLVGTLVYSLSESKFSFSELNPAYAESMPVWGAKTSQAVYWRCCKSLAKITPITKFFMSQIRERSVSRAIMISGNSVAYHFISALSHESKSK